MNLASALIPPPYGQLVTVLANFAPQIVTLLGGKKAGEVAEKVIDIAKDVTGIDDPAQAVDAIQRNPELAFKFQEVLANKEVELARIDADVSKAYFAAETEIAKSVNETMREEAKSEHWAQWLWRPSVGFSFAAGLTASFLVVLMAYVAVIFFGKDVQLLTHIPSFLTAMAALLGIAMPILGVSAYTRGKEKLAKLGG